MNTQSLLSVLTVLRKDNIKGNVWFARTVGFASFERRMLEKDTDGYEIID